MNYICSHQEYMPCQYCTHGARQQCKEIFPPWFTLTDNILSCYCCWAEAPEPAHPALAEHLKEYKHTFNQVAHDCNLPNAPLKPNHCCCNTLCASSCAIFCAPLCSSSRDCLWSPQAIGPPLQQHSCSPPPVCSSYSSAHHACVPSHEVYDNHTELVWIMERLMEEACIKHMKGLNMGNQATFWGVMQQFFQ